MVSCFCSENVILKLFTIISCKFSVHRVILRYLITKCASRLHYSGLLVLQQALPIENFATLVANFFSIAFISIFVINLILLYFQRKRIAVLLSGLFLQVSRPRPRPGQNELECTALESRDHGLEITTPAYCNSQQQYFCD